MCVVVSISIRAAAVDMMVKAKQVINFNGQFSVSSWEEEKLRNGKGEGSWRAWLTNIVD